MGNGTHCKHGVHYGDVCGKCTAIYTEEELQAAITEAIEEDRAKRAAEEGKAEPRPGGLRSIEQAARALVAKILEIHDDPRYEAVWTIAHVHGQPYKGPTYEAELEALQTAFARSELDRTAAAQAPTAQSAPPPAGPARQDKDLEPSPEAGSEREDAPGRRNNVRRN